MIPPNSSIVLSDVDCPIIEELSARRVDDFESKYLYEVSEGPLATRIAIVRPPGYYRLGREPKAFKDFQVLFSRGTARSHDRA